MIKTLLFVCLVGAAVAQQNDNEDGSYDPVKHELPYAYRDNDVENGPRAYSAPSYSAPAPVRPSYSAPANNYQLPAQPAPRPQQAYRTHSDPKHAAILSEARYLSGDGKFGASYSQDDGVEFKEESDPDGTRRGSYSYVDPSGQRRTVSYTAGKNGFQATGDHLPQAPAAPAHTAQPQYRQPAPQQYQPQQYQPQQYQPQQYQAPQQYQPQQFPQAQPQAYQAGPQRSHQNVQLDGGSYSISSAY